MEQIVPFTHAEHAFIKMGTTQEFIHLVFGHACFHLCQLICGGEGATIVSKWGRYFIYGWENRVVGCSFAADMAFGGTSRQHHCQHDAGTYFNEWFCVHFMIPNVVSISPRRGCLNACLPLITYTGSCTVMTAWITGCWAFDNPVAIIGNAGEAHGITAFTAICAAWYCHHALTW